MRSRFDHMPWTKLTWPVWRLQTFNNSSAERRFSENPNMVRKKQKNIFKRHRNVNPTPTTSHDASQPAVTEETPGETSMEMPLPNTPQASRPGTPEDSGPTFENCRRLQELTTTIDLYSTSLENTHTLLKGVMQSGLKDPNNPIIRKETSYMELTNERLQQAVMLPARATELHREPHLRRQEHPSTGLIASSTPVMISPPSHVPHVR
ncbi:hypothetical protein TNCV_4792501 [Trichonephila clavipes]|nr:hypothetical protein TNCV_4792501 [Trichonephila clavipes]